MQRNIFAGAEFLLYNIDDQPVAYSTNCAIKINNNLIDITTKSSDSWSESMVGIKDWSIEFEGLVNFGTGFTSTYLLEKYQSNEPFFVKFGVQQDNFSNYFSGEVHIESLDQTADEGDISTFSGTLKGVGNLSFTNEGIPEQSGYIKVETDPIFTSSPAYSISDNDKVKWNEANNKIVQEISSTTTGGVTTLKLKFKDGNIYSTSFHNINSIDLSSYYNKSESDQLIATAQVAADTANALIFNIASDSKLSPSEKINVLKEWLIIQDEKAKLIDQAVIYQVETLDYSIAYIDLEEYLEPLLISMVTTDDISGSEFRNMFRAYYDQKILLLKSINEAAKTYTDSITIGGRNYFLKGDKIRTVSTITDSALQTGTFPIESELAISFYARSIDGTSELTISFDNSDEKEFTGIEDEWQRFTCVLHTTAVPVMYARVNSGMSLFAFSSTGGFPYSFPASFGSNISSGIQLKNIMVVLGKKPMDFSPAPEDFSDLINKAKTDAQNAAKAYADAQDLYNQTVINANLDGIVTQLEQTYIDLAEENLLAAKQYADAQALNAKVLANAYADGKIDDIESQIIDASDTNIQAAKDYTDAQRALSETVTKAYADGKIDDIEAVLIQNAEDNLAAAKAYSDAQDLYTKTLSDAYADQKITAEEARAIADAEDKLQAAKDDATTKANAAAAYGIAAQNLHNALVSNLKSLAYLDVVEVAKLGDTVVTGGYLKTSLLDANYIKTGIVNADYIESLELVSKVIKTATSGQRVEIKEDNTIKFFISGTTNPVVTIDDKLIVESNSPEVKGPGIIVGDNDNQGNGFTQIGRKWSYFNGEVSITGDLHTQNLDHQGAKTTDYKFLNDSQSYTITSGDYLIISANSNTITLGTGQNFNGREIKISTCYSTTTTTFSAGGKYIHGLGALDGTSISLPANGVYSFVCAEGIVVSI